MRGRYNASSSNEKPRQFAYRGSRGSEFALAFWEENQAGSLTRESILTLAARQTHRVLRCSKLEARRMLYTGLQGSPFPYRAAGLWEGAGVWSPLPR